MEQEKWILIVDDVKFNRAILAEQFSKDYRILEAENGQVAMEQILQHQDHLTAIMLDLLMPVKDGFFVLEQMKALGLLQSIPVLVTSAGDELQYELRAIEMGAVDYLVRPMDPRITKLRLQSAISRIENERLRVQNEQLQKEFDDKQRFQTVLTQTNTTILEFDPTFSEVVCDNSLQLCIPGSYDGKNFLQELARNGVADPNTLQTIDHFFTEAKSSYQTSATLCVQLSNPEHVLRWFRLTLLKVLNETGSLKKFFLTINDVNEEIVYQQELVYLAEHDQLTGICNRLAFCQHTARMLAQNPEVPYLLVRCDVEKFKAVNEIYGHERGNQLLRHIADSITRFLDGSGTCGRLRDDVFVLCYPYTEERVAHMLAWCRRELAKEDLNFNLSMSFGLYVIADINEPVETMIDRAGIAQYTVKGHYENTHAYYNEEIRRQMDEERFYEQEMNHALETEQFAVYFQPKCRIHDGSVQGAEALVRWIHPECGMISPGKFIPVFEKNGFITKLDHYVWEHTCRYLRSWLDCGLPVVPVSVNVSRVNIYKTGLLATLTALVQQYRIPTTLLELEITESAYTNNPYALCQLVDELRDAGFRVHMDDFGSGYSSLNMLKDIHVDVLKLDLRFLHGEDKDGRGGSIIYSIVRMAKWLDLSVIAEGVETAQQADFLYSIGCDNAQGYLYYKPLPANAFGQVLAGSHGSRKAVGIASFNDDLLNDPFTFRQLFGANASVSYLLNVVIGAIGIFQVSSRKAEALRVNRQYVRMFGNVDTLFGPNDGKDFIDHEDLERIFERLDHAKNTSEVVSTVYRRQLPDGQTMRVYAKARFLYSDPEGSLYYIAFANADAPHDAD